jgi:hypothetical protein
MSNPAKSGWYWLKLDYSSKEIAKVCRMPRGVGQWQVVYFKRQADGNCRVFLTSNDCDPEVEASGLIHLHNFNNPTCIWGPRLLPPRNKS